MLDYSRLNDLAVMYRVFSLDFSFHISPLHSSVSLFWMTEQTGLTETRKTDRGPREGRQLPVTPYNGTAAFDAHPYINCQCFWQQQYSLFIHSSLPSEFINNIRQKYRLLLSRCTYLEHSTVHNSPVSKSAKTQRFSKPDNVYSAKPLRRKRGKRPDLCEYIQQ